MELVSSFADLRGHDIGVTALDAGRAGLADYALVRRAARGLGRAAADGEHYCHAAPGVNTTLAMMKDRFRGQLGNVELVRRLMATAGDRLHADDDPAHEGATSARYGVGVVDPAAAPDPVGALATGAAGNGAPLAPLAATRLVAPSAYGDALARVAGVEIAAFDVRNASFWTPAGRLVEAAPAAEDPMPRFEAGVVARGGCPVLAGLAPVWDCLPPSRAASAHRLAGPDGAGLPLDLVVGNNQENAAPHGNE